MLAPLIAGLFISPALATTYRTATEYDSARRPIRVTDALGNVTETAYDRAGRVIRVARQAPAAGTVAQWLVTCTSYTATGQKLRVWGPWLTATATTCPSTTSVSVPRVDYTYDDADRLDTEKVFLDTAGGQPNRTTKTLHDAAGQVLQVQKAVGIAGLQQNYATYTYTLNGKQEYVTDANGNKAQFAYDGFDRLQRWYFPSKTTVGAVELTDYEEYGYDANGNRTSLKKRSNPAILYAYDELNRVERKLIPGSLLAADDTFYSYDLRGLQTGARFGSYGGEGITNDYDPAGRLEWSSINQGGITRKLEYEYDPVSNRERVKHPDGVYFDYKYDPLNRMTEIRDNAGGYLHCQEIGCVLRVRAGGFQGERSRPRGLIDARLQLCHRARVALAAEETR